MTYCVTQVRGYILPRGYFTSSLEAQMSLSKDISSSKHTNSPMSGIPTIHRERVTYCIISLIVSSTDPDTEAAASLLRRKKEGMTSAVSNCDSQSQPPPKERRGVLLPAEVSKDIDAGLYFHTLPSRGKVTVDALDNFNTLDMFLPKPHVVSCIEDPSVNTYTLAEFIPIHYLINIEDHADQQHRLRMLEKYKPFCFIDPKLGAGGALQTYRKQLFNSHLHTDNHHIIDPSGTTITSSFPSQSKDSEIAEGRIYNDSCYRNRCCPDEVFGRLSTDRIRMVGRGEHSAVACSSSGDGSGILLVPLVVYYCSAVGSSIRELFVGMLPPCSAGNSNFCTQPNNKLSIGLRDDVLHCVYDCVTLARKKRVTVFLSPVSGYGHAIKNWTQHVSPFFYVSRLAYGLIVPPSSSICPNANSLTTNGDGNITLSNACSDTVGSATVDNTGVGVANATSHVSPIYTGQGCDGCVDCGCIWSSEERLLDTAVEGEWDVPSIRAVVLEYKGQSEKLIAGGDSLSGILFPSSSPIGPNDLFVNMGGDGLTFEALNGIARLYRFTDIVSVKSNYDERGATENGERSANDVSRGPWIGVERQDASITYSVPKAVQLQLPAIAALDSGSGCGVATEVGTLEYIDAALACIRGSTFMSSVLRRDILSVTKVSPYVGNKCESNNDDIGLEKELAEPSSGEPHESADTTVVFSLMNYSFAFMNVIDEGSENWRWMGNTRFTVKALTEVMFGTLDYKIHVKYVPAENEEIMKIEGRVDNKMNAKKEDVVSPKTDNSLAVFDIQERSNKTAEWINITSDRVSCLTCANTSYISRDTMIAPGACMITPDIDIVMLCHTSKERRRELDIKHNAETLSLSTKRDNGNANGATSIHNDMSHVVDPNYLSDDEIIDIGSNQRHSKASRVAITKFLLGLGTHTETQPDLSVRVIKAKRIQVLPIEGTVMADGEGIQKTPMVITPVRDGLRIIRSVRTMPPGRLATALAAMGNTD